MRIGLETRNCLALPRSCCKTSPHAAGPASKKGNGKKVMAPGSRPTKGWELVIPNPKLKLIDQVREVLRVKHYAIRTGSLKFRV